MSGDGAHIKGPRELAHPFCHVSAARRESSVNQDARSHQTPDL